jgi:integrase
MSTGLRRTGLPSAEPRPSRFTDTRLVPAVAPTPDTPPRPAGDLDQADMDDIAVACGAFIRAGDQRHQARSGIRVVLRHLAGFPGEGWQDRWRASGLDTGTDRIVERFDRAGQRSLASAGLRTLFGLRVIRPSLNALLAHRFVDYARRFADIQQDPLLEEYLTRVAKTTARLPKRQQAGYDVAAALTTQGIALVDLTPEAFLHYCVQRRQHAQELNPSVTRFGGILAWEVLYESGHFPPHTPPTLRGALYRGQRPVAELVDRYPIRNRQVRDLLVDYLGRREHDVDYNTLDNLARELVSLFWCTLEQINPAQQDLRLDADTYNRWREAVATTRTGRDRIHIDHLLATVRGLYLDLHSWAVAEPQRWARWVAPCPIPASQLRQQAARRRRANERSADRTRLRQPLLPALVAAVETDYESAQALLKQARMTEIGGEFSDRGTRYQRFHSRDERRLARAGDQPPVRVRNMETGEAVNLEQAEESLFWEWAAVGVLRHSGIRIEELLELTHLSIRQYQRPNAEVIALLVIAPSKTDRERVIPMSAELFHVIAAIIRRHTAGGRTIPMLSRYDSQEKVWSPLLPFLFQRQHGAHRRVIAYQTILDALRRRCASLAETQPAFVGIRFTPHDFRRIFATDLVNNGLPIHIGAALLGHLHLQTTRGYVAVFDEDVVRHYQVFLQARRALRPTEEYRPTTSEEWAEFERHFDKRKLELGNCGRPYATPCSHEHACIRCPMLQVDPKMIDRLDEIETDLLARRARAEAEGWLGELEGIELTLTFLNGKRTEAQRALKQGPIELGMPQRSRSKDSR